MYIYTIISKTMHKTTSTHTSMEAVFKKSELVPDGEIVLAIRDYGTRRSSTSIGGDESAMHFGLFGCFERGGFKGCFLRAQRC